VKTFSLFEQALKLSCFPQMDNAGQVSVISRQDFDERETFLLRTKLPSVEYACLMIENALLLRTNRSGRVYAGFEKLSCMKPVVDRYQRIADVSDSVYIFGEPDWKPPRHPNIRTIKLSADYRLAHECFVIADSSTLHIALVARDENGLEKPDSEQKSFIALKTSNIAAVTALANFAEGVIDFDCSLSGKAQSA
jgi:DICT domain-containing protein